MEQPTLRNEARGLAQGLLDGGEAEVWMQAGGQEAATAVLSQGEASDSRKDLSAE